MVSQGSNWILTDYGTLIEQIANFLFDKSLNIKKLLQHEVSAIEKL